MPLPPENDADLVDVGDFARGGLFWLLRERYETSQERGRVFERLMQYAFRRHPDVYGPARFKNVWRWMEWPDREAFGYLGDVGIDLVAEQTDDWGGGLCAIQTKFNETSQVGKGAVDSFLSASSADIFTHRILVVTSSLSTHAKTMVSKTSPQCHVVYRADIERWPVDWSEFLEAPERLKFSPERYEPHPFQKEAVRRVVSGFEEHDRGKLILPCGTGKSVVSLWIAEKMAVPVGGSCTSCPRLP